MRIGKHCFCQKPLTHTLQERPIDGSGGAGIQRHHDDGQPGHGSPGAATRSGDHAIRRLGECQRGARLDEPSDLATGWPCAGALGPTGQRAMGSLVGSGQVPTVRRGVSSLLVARLVGLRYRRVGRHGLPYAEHAVHGTRSARSCFSRGEEFRPQSGQLSEMVGDYLSVPGHGLPRDRSR